MLEDIKKQSRNLAEELVQGAKLKEGQIVVVGCSSSEVAGSKIGCDSSPEIAEAIYEGLQAVFEPLGIYMAAQCCEHLNRALIVDAEIARDDDIVNVVPQPKAGGSFATATFKYLKNPVAVECIKADAGIDIGGTLIGMHLKKVAVPLRLETRQIGEAMVMTARTRRKFVGGERAVYDKELL